MLVLHKKSRNYSSQTMPVMYLRNLALQEVQGRSEGTSCRSEGGCGNYEQVPGGNFGINEG